MDASALGMLLLTVTSWLDRRERETLAYLLEENRLLRRQLVGAQNTIPYSVQLPLHKRTSISILRACAFGMSSRETANP
jgi:hypothetical protein